MQNNLETYRDDLEQLIKEGGTLLWSLKFLCYPEKLREQAERVFSDKENVDKFFETLPSFLDTYQAWYSESLILINQLLPNRVQDFITLYKKSSRKDVTYENYVIEDALQNLQIKNFGEKIVDRTAAIPRFQQQLSIIKGIKRRFESSLFDIRQLLQADLFDSELDASRELCNNGFFRGAGAMAGVVLEKHLLQVCENHNIKFRKKNPSIAYLNDRLKDSSIYDIQIWRKIQHLGDLRNLCDHNKEIPPTKEIVSELIVDVESIIKTIY